MHFNFNLAPLKQEVGQGHQSTHATQTCQSGEDRGGLVDFGDIKNQEFKTNDLSCVNQTPGAFFCPLVVTDDLSKSSDLITPFQF